jgi:hypothetical protein
MRSEPDEKNAEKCKKKKSGKCGLNLWDFEKSPVCPDSSQEMGEKIKSQIKTKYSRKKTCN